MIESYASKKAEMIEKTEQVSVYIYFLDQEFYSINIVHKRDCFLHC